MSRDTAGNDCLGDNEEAYQNLEDAYDLLQGAHSSVGSDYAMHIEGVDSAVEYVKGHQVNCIASHQAADANGQT